MLEAVAHVHVSRWAGLAEARGSWTGDRLFAPDGIFPTSDGWVALSVTGDACWQRLLDAIGRPRSLDRAEWESNQGRLHDEGELSSSLASILRARPGVAWTQLLGAVGVPVGRLAHDDDVMLRRDLWDRDLLRDLPLDNDKLLRVAGPPWSVVPALPRIGVSRLASDGYVSWEEGSSFADLRHETCGGRHGQSLWSQRREGCPADERSDVYLGEPA